MAEIELINGCLIREHDYRGRSYPIYFRIPPDLNRQLYDIFNSSESPFQTKEELARYIFCNGIVSLGAVRPFRYSSSILGLAFVLYKPYGPFEPQKFINEVRQIVNDLAALGCRTPILQKFVRAVEDLVECLPSSDEREKYLKVMEQLWSSIWSSTKWPDHPSKKGYRAR